MAPKFLLLCLLLEILFCEFAHALWWSLGTRAVMDHTRICRKRGSRVSKDPQSTICRKEPKTFQMILDGSQMAMKECQYQFRFHRWNCTDNRRSLKKILMREKKRNTKAERRRNKSDRRKDPSRRRKGRPRGDRRRGRRGKGKRGDRARRGPGRGRRREGAEDASNASFVDPEGRVGGEPLGTTEVEPPVGEAAPGAGTPPEGEWKWSGCDDNVGFGYRVARDFMDWRYLRGPGSQDIRSIVMLHNNEVGRLAVQRHLQPHCKCHGLSGSCTHRTCWKRLPTFRSIGARLKEKFRQAIKVTPSNDGTSIRPVGQLTVSDEDLIFLEDSPDFCRPNKRTGSLGTYGRVCNVTANDMSGCDLMCCGRGIRQEVLELEENCRCRFKFCCEVTCQKCRIKRKMSYCL
ncbi:protein Wnt-6-like [Penaeus monodon]|uniref:protein Wnt-6-like n=1 Tax=Penaeus monodon TaxID=6687 RepID=UPI0018A75279|nr:protein Wnt-6-like [Penaeus monodon]